MYPITESYVDPVDIDERDRQIADARLEGQIDIYEMAEMMAEEAERKGRRLNDIMQCDHCEDPGLCTAEGVCTRPRQ